MTKSLPPKSLVLYADDDPDDIELVQDAFKAYYHNVELLTFRNGVELLNYINSPKNTLLPCLIILDVNMPRMNGKEVLLELRRNKELEEVPVVLFSTSTLPSELAFAKSYDAGFLTKPLHAKQIFQLVDQMLQHCSEEVRKSLSNRRNKQ